jgi:periplasmic copper chaperone A
VGRNNHLLCGAALLGLAVLARAADFRSGDLLVSQPWARPTPPTATVGAVYFAITNLGKKADRLLAISTPLADKVEMHDSRTVQGVLEMRAVDFVECPPGATVKAQPGGLHVMLQGLKQPLAAHAQFPLTLRFRDAAALTVQVQVEVVE